MKKETSVRQLALDCLIQLEAPNTTIAPVIDRAIRQHHLGQADRGLLNELVYGAIRWRKQLDWVLGHFIEPNFRLDRRTQNLLRLGAYQLLHLDKIPPHAAIYEMVELAKPRRKTAGFINAVLRSVQRGANRLEYPALESQPAQHIAISRSYPLWLVERWLAQHGVAWTLAFCRASNQIAPLSIRVNTLKTDRAELVRSLTADGASVKASQIAPDGLLLLDAPPLQSLQAYLDGWFYVQDESAMLVAHLLRPQRGEKVVDLCAAPGGKTTHIAQLMGNSSEIIAIAPSQDKVQRIEENCRRLGVTTIQTRTADVAIATLDILEDAGAVLIDAPCSGLGTLRRHPDIRWKKSPEQIDELAQLQLQILKNVARQVKPGCVLVYSTCSTEPEENEGVVRRFLGTHPHFIIETAGGFLPFIPSSAITPEGFLQTFPHEHGIDGAFAARLRAKER
ncbi:16S rRNA (cytosine(967)-C(5))-methyltransferase RsmB [Candidatus Poribacteria bacterium]|nr:16S rRNA (cytosine(967)-C(5))-methyltransferase RsmB [Candidatus Poribacteria bacterium]